MSRMDKRTCVVPVCSNMRFHLVHKFPMKDDRAELWRKALNIPELMTMHIRDIRIKYLVCSRHFRKTDYKNENSRSLNWNAVPSINLLRFDDKDCHDSATFDVLTNEPIFSPTKPAAFHHKEPKILPIHISKTSTKAPLKKTGPVQELNLSVPGPAKQKIAKPSASHVKRALISSDTPVPVKRIKTAKLVKQAQALERDNREILLTTDDLTGMRIFREHVLNPFVEAEMPSETVSSENAATFLILPGTASPIDYFWLRDHCRCKECYNYSTNQRKLNIRSIPLDIQAVSSEIDGDLLRVIWPDGHVSQYSVDALHKQTLERRQMERRPAPVTWTGETIQRYSYARVSMNDYLVDDQVSRSVVQSLVDYGVAFVEKVPANATFTEIVIKRLFAVHRTYFGEIWTFSDGTGDYLDTAFTTEALPAHTDNTYFNDAAGLQVLHCIEYEATGGLSLLVDGFKVLENLRASAPDAYERLKRYQIPAENKDKQCHHTHCGPIIIEDPVDGQLQQIRYNNPDRAVMDTLPMAEMRQFYGDLQKLAEEVERPENEFWLQLKPGTVMFFNNYRLLHGRSAFSGKRVMSGGYVSRTEFMSVARTMNIVP